jgi:flavin reductase (DIM6/NTAB) family NADH-FMN oxidoreductase RutF
MSDDAFDAIMESVDARMVVVTASSGSERAGCLVGFHSQSSIEPARYSVWLSKANHTYRVALRSTHLGVHFLTAHDLQLAERFGTLTGDETDKFAGLAVRSGDGDVPLLENCANWVVLRRTALLDEGGDHVCVAGEIVAAGGRGTFEALRLSRVSHLVPGHSAEERPDPPTERAAPGG